MEESVKKGITDFLLNNYNVMAYSLIEMKRVSKDVIVYRLNMRKEAKAVKQKNRIFALK